jgi:hypothetical protein
MKAPQSILSTWRKFDEFPMETLTKAWFYHRAGNLRQRSVSQMREHRMQYGISGNCFDLALWLLDEFQQDGIQAYPIGHDIGTDDAHVAVMALDENGQRYLCDLGDQWLNPILIDVSSEDYSNEKCSGFFPAAEVQIVPVGKEIQVIYHRPNGKISKQLYITEPIDRGIFLEAAEYCQNHVYEKPLLEVRKPYKNEIAHWEFYNWKSFLSTTDGIFHDSPLGKVEEWVERINKMTGFSKGFLLETLRIYEDISNEFPRR